MFNKVVIANRGEIALRILRACHQLNIKTVAVYSSADKQLPHVKLADESYCIGPANAADSYLNMTAIISVANITCADAIHPGYGLLSENAEFAELVTRSGYTFIGPSSQVIELMGDKIAAITAMKQAGVPTVPGSNGPLSLAREDEKLNLQIANTLGYPVIIKAAGGGGGRGMRIVHSKAELNQNIAITASEAKRFFANDQVYIEKYLAAPRHIEVQVAADSHGQAIHLGSRDCSAQKRHQKVVEEAPALGIAQEKLERLYQSCIQACHNIGYQGLGTFEFLYQNGEFYFIEMNTRLQVEHTITEMISGVDLVQMQLKIAAGLPLEYKQQQVRFQGYAIECRINAENSFTGIPSPGTISKLTIPGGLGIRWDSHIYQGYRVPQEYDPMIAKLIAYGDNRQQAIIRLKQALSELNIGGIETNISLLQQLVEQAIFSQPNTELRHIHYLEQLLDSNQHDNLNRKKHL